jgi:hypothetical protein
MSALTQATDATTPSPSLTTALDYSRLDAIAEMDELAASYWHAISLAADRGERLTIETHCRQIAAVTREAFATVKSLGSLMAHPSLNGHRRRD